MMLETLRTSQDKPVHVSARQHFWLDLIDLEQIPELGTFLLVDQLLKQATAKNDRHIRFAAKLLSSKEPAPVTIHIPNVCSPRDFLEKMLHASDAFFTETSSPTLEGYARALKQNLEQFELSWNSESVSRFLLSWKNFTRQFLKCKVEALLETV